MTGRAHDQGVASFLEHDLCPRGSIVSHVFEIGQCPYLMDHARFICEGTPFTGGCEEPSSDLLPLVADDWRITINQDSFLMSSQRDAATAGDQGLLSTSSDQLCFQTRPAAMWRVDGGVEACGDPAGGTVICCGQRVGEGWLNRPSGPIEPGDSDGQHRGLDNTPLVLVRRFHDGRIGAGGQRASPEWCSSWSIHRTLLFPHVLWDAQSDVSVDMSVPIVSTCLMAVLGLHIVAQKARGVRARVSDQRLFLRAFQRERVVQVCSQVACDLFGFCSRP